ncbi:MAG: hypothetical protein JO112_01490 [Planctomycetes bacterium]|nr:hypothetical protein [Planctomycetota bacterium]
MNPQEYRTNRARFPQEELQKFQGKWVAFSLHGDRILASAENLADFDQRLVAVGQDPEQVALEYISSEDLFLGSGELT